jgi:hypothetical protein
MLAKNANSWFDWLTTLSQIEGRAFADLMLCIPCVYSYRAPTPDLHPSTMLRVTLRVSFDFPQDGEPFEPSKGHA